MANTFILPHTLFHFNYSGTTTRGQSHTDFDTVHSLQPSTVWIVPISLIWAALPWRDSDFYCERCLWSPNTDQVLDEMLFHVWVEVFLNTETPHTTTRQLPTGWNAISLMDRLLYIPGCFELVTPVLLQQHNYHKCRLKLSFNRGSWFQAPGSIWFHIKCSLADVFCLPNKMKFGSSLYRRGPAMSSLLPSFLLPYNIILSYIHNSPQSFVIAPSDCWHDKLMFAF